ncbi:hypothetical protein [Legionella clemsonensis]|nr:hypothetical protein [Legionella clemsonensis]
MRLNYEYHATLPEMPFLQIKVSVKKNQQLISIFSSCKKDEKLQQYIAYSYSLK